MQSLHRRVHFRTPPATPDYVVSSAGDAAYDGDYYESGAYEGQPKYTSAGGKWLFLTHVTTPGTYRWALSGTVQEYGQYSGIPYYATTIDGAYTAGSGTAPAPTVAAG